MDVNGGDDLLRENAARAWLRGTLAMLAAGKCCRTMDLASSGGMRLWNSLGMIGGWAVSIKGLRRMKWYFHLGANHQEYRKLGEGLTLGQFYGARTGSKSICRLEMLEAKLHEAIRMARWQVERGSEN